MVVTQVGPELQQKTAGSAGRYWLPVVSLALLTVVVCVLKITMFSYFIDFRSSETIGLFAEALSGNECLFTAVLIKASLNISCVLEFFSNNL